jgi:hypothetical protein
VEDGEDADAGAEVLGVGFDPKPTCYFTTRECLLFTRFWRAGKLTLGAFGGAGALGREELSSLWAAGGGTASTTVSLSFSKLASRPCTERSVHPLWASPVLKRTMFLVTCSIKMPMPFRKDANAIPSARHSADQ